MTPASVTVDREGTVTGNTYDKYGSTNPVVKRLMAGFEATLEELFAMADPSSILDVGCGEGVLTEKWARRCDGTVVGIDLDDPELHAEWEKRSCPNLEYRVMKAENLPFDDDSFDTVVSTLVLCTVPDQQRAIAEIRRVLKPGGQLLFIEHVRSDDPKTAKWQDRLHRPWHFVGHGCNCNRDTAEALTRAGFRMEMESWRMPKAPPIVRPVIEGAATSRG